MSEISLEILKLWRQYGGDVKQILKEHGEVEYFYALSDIRENLLEWYEFDPDGSLLQVGAGEGALTGLFGRQVKSVTVLDPSEEELAVVRERHEGCAGEVICRRGVLSDLTAADQYDYVVMAGSLTPPYDEQISRAKACLKPGGRLIVAVCNTFGLKYQAGAPRDEANFSKSEITRLLLGCHQEKDAHDKARAGEYRYRMSVGSDGVVYSAEDGVVDSAEAGVVNSAEDGAAVDSADDGVVDSTEDGTPEDSAVDSAIDSTEDSGRAGGDAGAVPDGTLTFYYPMPDYKTPTVIYSDQYLPAKGDLTHVVCAYDYPRYLHLDEGEMFDAVCENHQFETYANSYLIIWSGHEDDKIY